MATNEISADLIVSQFRDAATGGTWKTMVCETSLNGEVIRSATELATKCGTIKTSNPIAATISGAGVANTAPTASQVSLKQALDWINLDTLLEARMVNLVDGSVALGDAVLLKGDGRFSRVAPAANAGEALTFDWEFGFSGTLDFDESDES